MTSKPGSGSGRSVARRSGGWPTVGACTCRLVYGYHYWYGHTLRVFDMVRVGGALDTRMPPFALPDPSKHQWGVPRACLTAS